MFQHAEYTATQIYVRSARSTLSVLLDTLTKGNDPDRMKGALYVLGDKGIMSYALADEGFHTKSLVSLLECQHEEKPSIQKLINNFALECLTHLHEDVLHTDAYSLQTAPAVDDALTSLQQGFSPAFIPKSLLDDALSKMPIRVAKRNAIYEQTITSILEIASRPNTHVRLVRAKT
ncbi:hypothetical protein BT96DRAFT_1074301 [Gymnopus androsaceus JB14]|uniref:ARM repeat-containing protein n=1 Tax=Gymnopus androsaceus JB14 TaxID=1447944 RepID=A0A6A4GSL0_9AGAR|nr:hypothetical protein BT96DRAFT_1074301 [Gymnopus androsaceus JB14]